MSAKRILSALILSSILLSFTACGSESAETTAPVTTAAPAVDDTPKELVPDIPDDVTFDGGIIKAYGMQYLVEGKNGTEEEPSSALSQELYDRNKRVEERLGITFEWINKNGLDWTEIMKNAVRQSVNSGSADYDVVFSTGTVQFPLVGEGVYLPITELPYVDIDKPWWNRGYMESVSFHAETPYVLYGNLTYNQVERTTAVFANVTQLSNRHNIVAEDLFKLVNDGEWTLDKFTELVNLGYYDENGDTKKNNGDMFGLVYTGDAVNWVAYGSGLDFSARDEDGFISLNLNTERSVDLADKLVKLFSKNDSVLFMENQAHVDAFGQGKSLFVANRLYLAGWQQLREMKDDFIILPFPKYDSSVDGYHGVVENQVQLGCVTTTVKDEDLEMISAALELMSYDGYNTVVPLYYENELKLKYTRNDDIDMQSRMIDIITSGARTDYLFSNGIGSLHSIFKSCVDVGQNNFASLYARLEPQALVRLDQLIDKYEEMIYG